MSATVLSNTVSSKCFCLLWTCQNHPFYKDKIKPVWKPVKKSPSSKCPCERGFCLVMFTAMTGEKGGVTKHSSFSRDKPYLMFFDIKQCATVVSVSELLAGEVDTNTIFTCPTQQVRMYCLQQYILSCNYWKFNRRSARTEAYCTTLVHMWFLLE